MQLLDAAEAPSSSSSPPPAAAETGLLPPPQFYNPGEVQQSVNISLEIAIPPKARELDASISLHDDPVLVSLTRLLFF